MLRATTVSASATSAQKAALSKLSPEMVSASTLAGDPITARLTAAPGNGASIGGLKVMTENGWFAARPSGTEDAYKIYCESFLGAEHRQQIEKEAVEIVSEVLKTRKWCSVRADALTGPLPQERVKKNGNPWVAVLLPNYVYSLIQTAVRPARTASSP